MRRKVIAFVAVALVSLALGIIVSPATGLYDMTVRVVSSTGTVLNGTASAVTAFYDKTVRIVNSSNQVIDSFGGTVPALQYTVNNVGATNTPACNFNLGYICIWQQSGGATVSVSNIPGTTTSPITVSLVSQGTAGSVQQVTLPGTFFLYNGSGNYFAGQTYHTNNNGASNMTVALFTCNGTNCYGSGGLGADLFGNAIQAVNLSLGTDNLVSTMTRESFPSFVDATAATTTIPYGCNLTTKAVTFENVQFTVTTVTQSVAPSLSLCDTGTTANPVACGTTIVNSGTFTAAGNISLTSMTNANVAAGHFVCTFFAAGTATVVIAQATGTARPQ